MSSDANMFWALSMNVLTSYVEEFQCLGIFFISWPNKSLFDEAKPEVMYLAKLLPKQIDLILKQNTSLNRKSLLDFHEQYMKAQ